MSRKTVSTHGRCAKKAQQSRGRGSYRNTVVQKQDEHNKFLAEINEFVSRVAADSNSGSVPPLTRTTNPQREGAELALRAVEGKSYGTPHLSDHGILSGRVLSGYGLGDAVSARGGESTRTTLDLECWGPPPWSADQWQTLAVVMEMAG